MMRRFCGVCAGLTVLLLAVAGCALEPAVEQGTGVMAMVMTNHVAGTMTYDATPVTWNVEKNALWSTGKVVLHAEDRNGFYPAPWSSGSPVAAVQTWTRPSGAEPSQPVLTAKSDDADILEPPADIRLSTVPAGVRSDGQWYVPGRRAFLLAFTRAASSGKGVHLTICEAPVAAGPSPRTLTVPLPSVPEGSCIVYGSGDLDNGFLLLDIPVTPRNNMATYDLALLRLQDGKATLIRCSNPGGFNWDLVSAVSGSCARVGSLLYFTHWDGKVGCIDTSAAVPAITVPEKINAFVERLRETGGKDITTVRGILACDDGKLIIGYPDADWSWSFSAVDAAGNVLGRLHATSGKLTSYDAAGRAGASLRFRGMDPSLLFPSEDLFMN